MTTVALLGASHWHVPLYLPALRESADVVAVSDPDANAANFVAGLVNAKPYSDWRRALGEARQLDAVFLFGRHSDMAEMAAAVIDRQVPLVIEKPGGRDAIEVMELANLAAAMNVPVAVAFIQRLGPLPSTLALAGDLDYATFRFMVGPPHRYLEAGSAWMLDPAVAGGGCFLNLGIHFIDLFSQLTGNESVDRVDAQMHRRAHSQQIEDHATMTLTTQSSASCLIEVGYTYPNAPDKRHVAYSASGTGGFVAIDSNGLVRHTAPDGSIDVRHIDVDSDNLYSRLVTTALKEADRGFPSLPSIGDLAVAMGIVNRAYQSASTGGGSVT